MIHKKFVDNAVEAVINDSAVIGLAVGGSWLTKEIDEYSDLDLVLVTAEKISHDKTRMLQQARRLGNLLSGFTGEHVGEPRLLICLYSNPLLHVDVKFVTPDEFQIRVEDPVILVDKQNILTSIINDYPSRFPLPDFQWIEDRFWTWIHYALLKVGRGEYFEAHDFLAYLRSTVFGPLLHIKNGQLPRGVRKLEFTLPQAELKLLDSTLAEYNRTSIMTALQKAIDLYLDLRENMFDSTRVTFRKETEKEVISYYHLLNQRLQER